MAAGLYCFSSSNDDWRAIQYGSRCNPSSSGPSGFANSSEIPGHKFAREILVITEEFKSDVSYMQRYEVIKPFEALEGPIGPQVDHVNGRLLEGGQAVWLLDLGIKWNPRLEYFKPAGFPIPLNR